MANISVAKSMMTFLIIGDFVLNAKLLDDQRLAKQRVEARQILDAIENGSAWSNHPIVHAWRNYTNALKYYTNCIIREFIMRGGNNNLPLFDIPKMILIPWWSNWDRLHQSHRAMLMRKNPFYYKDKFSVDPEYQQYGYIWPHYIKYEDRFAPLNTITFPIPDDLKNPIYCNSVLKSGKRKGSPCQRLIKGEHVSCTIHRK
jgi:hypothetical protein